MRTINQNINLIIILLLCSVAGYSQNIYTDSLKEVLATEAQFVLKVEDMN